MVGGTDGWGPAHVACLDLEADHRRVQVGVADVLLGNSQVCFMAGWRHAERAACVVVVPDEVCDTRARLS